MENVQNEKLRRKEILIAITLVAISVVAIGCVESSKTVVLGDDDWIKTYKMENENIIHDLEHNYDATKRQDTEDMYYYYKQLQSDTETYIDAESAYQTSEKIKPARDEWMKSLQDYNKCAEIVLSCYDSDHNFIYRSKIKDANPVLEDASTHQINSINLLQKSGAI